MDSTHVITTGECKQGMDISYQGEWGYHPLLFTLANTGELLALVNRSRSSVSPWLFLWRAGFPGRWSTSR